MNQMHKTQKAPTRGFFTEAISFSHPESLGGILRLSGASKPLIYSTFHGACRGGIGSPVVMGDAMFITDGVSPE